VYCELHMHTCVAVVQAELNDEQDETDVDVMVQLLAPLLNSQHFLIEELKTAYRSVTCENGFVFVFAEVCPVVFCIERTAALLVHHSSLNA